jgi:CheY-like chemotaxis protein
VTEAPVAGPDGTAGHVLVVEDDADLRDAMVESLRVEGFEVASAEDGERALAYLRSAPRPAVILLDLMMPRMNGWEFRAAQRADPYLTSIPVVVVSGDARTEANASLLGATACLIKPIDFDKLVAILRTVGL